MRGRVGESVRVPLLVILTVSSAAAVGVLRVTGTLLTRRTGSRVIIIITITIVGIIIVIIATEAPLHQKTELRNRETAIARAEEVVPISLK